MPERIQLSRKKGWRKPDNTIVVARPTKWGNPHIVSELGCYRCDHPHPDRESAVEAFRDDLATDEYMRPLNNIGGIYLPYIAQSLKGKNLACWCPLDEPCHADILLAIANGWDW